MRKPLYSDLYVKSPIVKIALGILSVILAVVILLGMGIIEEPRMQAQTENWQGRSIEKGADIYANNCATCHGIEGKGIPGPALHSRHFFTQRLEEVGFTGSLENYIALTVAAGRPSKVNSQWSVMMPTWGSSYGGPLRDDQVAHVTQYVLNWEQSALAQTPEEDPWIPFEDVPSPAPGETTGEPAGDTAEQPQEEATGPRPPQALFVEMTCNACHNLDQPQTDQSRGPVGPNMGNLAESAATRVEGQDAATYIHSSIVEPNAYVVQGYQPEIMPQNFAERMTTEEIDVLVAWLLDPNRQQ